MPLEPLDYRTPPSYSHDSGDVACPRCASRDFIEGSLTSGARIGNFLPKHVKNFWSFNNGVHATTHACLTCGLVSTTVNPGELLSKGATNLTITTPRKLGRMFRFLHRAH